MLIRHSESRRSRRTSGSPAGTWPSAIGRFVEVPLLPQGTGSQSLRALNARRLRQVEPADIVHHSFTNPQAFERWPGKRHITTVYDFIVERFFADMLRPATTTSPDMRRSFGGQTPSSASPRQPAKICTDSTPSTKSPCSRCHSASANRTSIPSPRNCRPCRKVSDVCQESVSVQECRPASEAYAEIATRHPDVHLVMVGGGNATETERLRELGIESKTVRLRVSDAVLPWIYRSARSHL